MKGRKLTSTMVVDFPVVALFFTETLTKHYGAAAGRPSSAPLGDLMQLLLV